MAQADTYYVEADIIALKLALKNRVRSVTTSDGKSVVFQSHAEGLALLRLMYREVYGRSMPRKIQLVRILTEGS